jgi:hypothetical protein
METPKGTDRIILTIDELKELSKHTTLETLSALGIDIRQPLEVQRDILFLHDLRRTTESVKGKTLCAVAIILVSSGLAALWLGIKSLL